MTPSPPPPEEPESWVAESGVLVGVDLRGIQTFVYEGHRLLDAVGRAALVADLTDTDPCNGHGIGGLLAGVDEHRVLRDAGGALSVAFGDAQRAKEFTACYTRWLREVSDQLVPVVAHVAFGPEQEAPSLAEAQERLNRELVHSRRGPTHTPVMGYGVTALCGVTGRPAEVLDNSRTDRSNPNRSRPERVARDVLHARWRGRNWHDEHAERWLAQARPEIGGQQLGLPRSVEHLGREMGDVSRQAVIHIDFNDLGDTLRGHRENLAADGEDPIAGMREVSQQIHTLTSGLAKAMTTAVADSLYIDDDGKPVITGSGADGRLRAYTHPTRGVQVPVRPIVVAGDDLTIVCDARLAWSLTRFALHWLDTVPDSAAAPDDPRLPFTTRLDEPWARTALLSRHDGECPKTGVPTTKVGIAVQPVGSHLIAAYRISEELCRLAKQRRAEEIDPDNYFDPKASEHVVAWSLDFDAPEHVIRRFEQRHTSEEGEPGAQPMLGTEFEEFLAYGFDPQQPTSLRGSQWEPHRSWLLSELPALLDGGAARGALDAELARRASLGLPTELPPWPRGKRNALLREAIDLLDTHLDVDLAAAPNVSPATIEGGAA
ncbi:hypothetical protein [Salinactinospora qingdaonensis]|uniref:Uncharacterized protein n=1 Tax=Salinactinospora qingdaonensis TaxID=702744 RepID=A0ABP7FW15_9ACTN